MAEDDEGPRRRAAHAVGEVLDDLSVRELDERIVLLRAEIDRLEAARDRKQSARDAAGSIFR